MEQKKLTKEIIDIIGKFQQNEVTEYEIYRRIACKEKDEKNRGILEQIANEEKGHADFWKSFTQVDFKPKKFKVLFFYCVIRLLGTTFGIKLMERGELNAQVNYAALLPYIPEIQSVINDEDDHEQKLIALIEEERLNYVGSIVLGLNDALVELTGALAGLSFGFQNTKVIAFAGLITGIAASFSMSAAEYLSQKHEGVTNPIKSATYTGIAYLATVGLLILPYLIFDNYLICLAITLSIAIFIILFFNYYVSVAKDLPFRKRFLEMAGISLGVSAITFGISVLIKRYFGIEM